MKHLTLLLALAFSASAISASPLHRLTRAMRFDGSQAIPEQPRMHVVMVHGFMENGDDFRTLRRRLHKQGIDDVVIRLTPSDARDGLEPLSAQLEQQVNDALGPEQRFSIVAFSMGGLVSRHYLQVRGGAKRCDQLITVSTPHHGTKLAHFFPGKGANQMQPDSDFLDALARTEDRLGDMPVTSLLTPLDLVILPSTRSIWGRADNRAYPVLLHPMMLQSHRVLCDIETCLLNHR